MAIKKTKPHPIDIAMGQRIRRLRQLRGMTQQELAKKIGCQFQQVQKYETGANRTSASRLSMIAEALDVSLSRLVEGIDDKHPGKTDNDGPKDRQIAKCAKYANLMNDERRGIYVKMGYTLLGEGGAA